MQKAVPIRDGITPDDIAIRLNALINEGYEIEQVIPVGDKFVVLCHEIPFE